MTYNEAKTHLAIAPARTDRPSKVSPGMTMADAVKIVSDWIDDEIAKGKGNEKLPSWGDKRVWQVVKNQSRPKITLDTPA